MIWWPTEVPTLHYGLITLRPSTEADIDHILAACQDPLIPQFTTVPSPYTLDHAIDFVRSDPFSLAERREIRFVIDYGTGSDAVFAGVISLHTVDIRNHTAEIGYWIEKSMRGKGIATIASRLITDHGIRTLGFRRIAGLVDTENSASQKVLLSAGYLQEGVMRNKVTREEGRQIDMALFSAIDSTWQPLDK